MSWKRQSEESQTNGFKAVIVSSQRLVTSVRGQSLKSW